MNRRLLHVAAATATIALSAGLQIASAQAVTPPTGTPDLALMALQPVDLQPGARVGIDAYQSPPSGFVAEYERQFGAATTTGGTALEGIQMQIMLANSTAGAKSFFTITRHVYGSRSGRALLANAIAAGRKGSNVKPGDVHFGKLRSIGVGQQSLLEPITLRVRSATNRFKPRTLAADVVVVRIDGVVVSLTVAGLTPTLAPSVASALAATVVSHITAVLAASGSTGSTGTTGTTGSTAATGYTGVTGASGASG
jgi:hypothetical protein